MAPAERTDPVALQPEGQPAARVVGPQQARLWISWGLVSVLLGYGIVQTVTTAANLFTE